MDYETEIDYLEATLHFLREAIENVKDTPYHGHLESGWELDTEEIQERLDELYEMQKEQWIKEKRQEELDYERSVLWWTQ